MTVQRPLKPTYRTQRRGTEVCRDPRFWFSYFTLGFGKRGPELDPDILSSAFGVDDATAITWWNDFTGWYEGVLDETDGEVDEPGLLELPMAAGGTLIVEAHPGDLCVYRARPAAEERELVANFGPHWFIPEWTLEGATEHAAGDPFLFLIFSPLVTLKADAQRAAAEERFADACVHGGLLTPAAASPLAREWARRCAGEESPR